jgi:hypothetical protein
MLASTQTRIGTEATPPKSVEKLQNNQKEEGKKEMTCKDEGGGKTMKLQLGGVKFVMSTEG